MTHTIRKLLFLLLAFGAPLAACATPITVPADLSPGDQYRLAFVTSTSRDATSAIIGDYNAFVTSTANAVPDLLALGTTWTAIASTIGEHAQINTATSPSETGFPIYRLDGQRLVDNNADLWDGDLDVSLSIDESGSFRATTVWTGTMANGFGFGGFLLGGVPNAATGDSTANGIDWVAAAPLENTNSESLYAISGVLTVPVPEPSSLTIGLLAAPGPYFLIRRRLRKVSRKRLGCLAERS